MENKSNKTNLPVFIGFAIAIVVIFIVINSIKPKQGNNQLQSIPEIVQEEVIKTSCVDETELNQWFQKRINEEAEWHKANYRFFFTAKRMNADPWAKLQTVMKKEPAEGVEEIKAYNKSADCTVKGVEARQELWDDWHIIRMESLEQVKASYPKIKEAS